MEAPSLPTRFPCWVQAVYSWGGETKRDLGFMEGDLIECLNAGDGSWWMGKLRRDKRMVGLFPSNFVKVLADDFQPMSRQTTPLMLRNGSITPSKPVARTPPAEASPSPQKNNSIFRKPFTAYAAAGAPNADFKTQGVTPSPSGSVNKSWKPKPYSSMKVVPQHSPVRKVPSPLRAPSPKIPPPIARARSLQRPPTDLKEQDRSPAQPYYTPSSGQSPDPYEMHDTSLQGTPNLYKLPSRGPTPMTYEIRAASPSPRQSYSLYHREPSPGPYQAGRPSPSHYKRLSYSATHEKREASSSPPPLPPTHRIPYTRRNSPSPDPSTSDNTNHGYHTPRIQSPTSSVSHSGMTPSPLRDAMNDVISSLEDMGKSKHNPARSRSPTPLNLLSAEAFDEIYAKSARSARPRTSQGFNPAEEQFDREVEHVMSQEGLYSKVRQDGPPQLTNYVQRMESRLRQLQQRDRMYENGGEDDETSPATVPVPPAKGLQFPARPPSSPSSSRPTTGYSNISRPASSFANSNASWPQMESQHGLKAPKSAYELGRNRLTRTFTAKSSVTNASSTAQSTSTSTTNTSNSTRMTSQSLMSGYSAGGFSATSAGSLAKRRWGLTGSIKGRSKSALGNDRPGTAMSGVSFYSSQHSGPGTGPDYSSASSGPTQIPGYGCSIAPPSEKKKGFFKKMLDSAKTSAAGARTNISGGQSSRPPSPQRSLHPSTVTAIAGPILGRNAAKEMGLDGNTMDWMQVRRDVNRSNSLSRNERNERAERCQMMDIPVLNPVDILNEAQGDEGADGQPVPHPTDFTASNLALVDKSARFVSNLPVMTNPVSLAQGYICRPYRSDVQRLRAIFTWVSERISWEEDFEGDIDTRRVIQTKRGCSEEIATLVVEMCHSVGLHAEVVRGYLKTPGEVVGPHNLNDAAATPNHWWNSVICDGEWRIMDCSLASPTNPSRCAYSAAGNQVAESWWFLARPMEICYTHVSLLPEQQHIVPPQPHDVLMTLPVANPPYFKNKMCMWDFDTSLLHLDNLEMAHIQLAVPDDVECVAEVETRAFGTDADGDFFENGEVIKKRALAQAEFLSVKPSTNNSWTNGTNAENHLIKRYTIKATLPSSSTLAVLKIYAGRRGLVHGISNNPHPLALSLPLSHAGKQNPEYDFFIRHPTPHALRHELYVVGPLCYRLAVGNNFVFAVRQHPGSPSLAAIVGPRPGSPARPGSALSMGRPGSALSMQSAGVVSGSAYSGSAGSANTRSGADRAGAREQQAPAKLAVQSPSGKILRMSRKQEEGLWAGRDQEDGRASKVESSAWETTIKVGERGSWRGLVLADRSARWCVFGEWECV